MLPACVDLDLHPVTVLLALCAWGVLWGVAGMVVAVPLTATLKITLAHGRRDDPLGLMGTLENLLEGRLE